MEFSIAGARDRKICAVISTICLSCTSCVGKQTVSLEASALRCAASFITT